MESTADIEVGDVVAPRAAVSIEITSTPVLSYALAHNRVPVVSRLAITNFGGPVRAATVRLSVRDAEGPIAQTVELLADLDEGRTTVLTDLGLVMDPAAMLHVEEQRPGVIDVEVESDGEILGEGSRVVQVLAAQQWLATPLPLALEMLAAYVMPNHPAITALVSEAAGVLEEKTGSGSLVGYSATPERVDEVVQAIAEVMHGRGIRYSEPPLSWSDLGQQVRSPGDVLTWRVGTPLDTVVVLAAALEQAGIRPLLWLADGHAFLGYWREERSAESAATTDAAPLVNLVDLGLIGLVETTLLTSMGEPGADLHRPAYTGWLTGELDRILGVTDVHRARRDGIFPLPARARDASGVLQVVEYRPALHSAPAKVEPPAPPPSNKPEAPPRVQQWKNALLDLSLRNRLINYTERSGLALAVPGTSLAALENFVHDGTPISLLPADQLAAVQKERGITTARELPEEQLAELLVDRREVHADVTTGGYLPRLRGLAYKAKTVQEETGANNLYLALGSLVWELDGRPLRSPLVLIPVTLAPMGRTGSYRLTLDESGSSTPNYCLLEKLRQLHGLVAPTLTENADGVLDLETALEAMRIALVGHGLPYRVEATADLAILQFAKFRLWKDLDEHWADFAANPLVHHLVHEPTEAFTDPARDTGELRRPRRAGRAAAGSGRRLAAAGDRRGRGRPDVRARGPARHRQVADHHQPAHPRGRRGQAGAVRRREAGGPGRRRAPAGRRRHGHVRPRPARQGLARLDGAGADPARAGARGRRRRAGPGRRRGDAALVPADARPATPTGCTRRTPSACRCTRRAPPSWPPARTSSRCRCPSRSRPTHRPTCCARCGSSWRCCPTSPT